MHRFEYNLSVVSAGLMLLTATLLSTPLLAQEEAEAVLDGRCSACHSRQTDGGMNRITNIRKSPEGWDMNLVRMQQWYGVQLNDQEQALLVKYLADKQGLAPSESAPYRAVIERRPGHIEPERDRQLTEFCARCHTYARFGLQRRDRDEWLKLVNTHVGQWPSIEYQALARDRQWWKIATTEVTDLLAEAYPLETAAWSDWTKRPWRDLSGDWRIAGHHPGRGGYTGTATIEHRYRDRYRVSYDLEYADGARIAATGEALLYTGYEWRGSMRFGTDEIREVYSLSEDGRHLIGRWFLADSSEVGADFHAVRIDGTPEIVAAQPAYLKAGERALITLHGSGLNGQVRLGADIRVERVVSTSAQTVVVEASVDERAAVGERTVEVGKASAAGLFRIYRSVGSVQVEPGYTIARVGGNGGPLLPVAAQFEAVGYDNGPDGKAGTADDLRIGVFPAEWSTDDYNEGAAAMQDKRFAGRIDQQGLFMPAGAGPNPKRKMSTNNAGDLAVKAVVDDGGRRVEGAAHLIVTVQRWNDPPLR